MTTALMVAIAALRVHPDNPREELEDLNELARSMREHGLLQPILVAPDPAAGAEHYLLHAGHRRVAAAKLLGWERIPATLREIPADRSLEAMLVENLQRCSLKPRQVAFALAKIRDMHDPPLTQGEIAGRLGKSPSWVSYMLLLTDLSEDQAEALDNGEISTNDATSLGRENRRAAGDTRVHDRNATGARGWHFDARHPLAQRAKLACNLAGHDRRRYCGIACGACWEALIRADALGEVEAFFVAISADIDEVVVEGLMHRAGRTPTSNPAERYTAFARLIADGKSYWEAAAACSMSAAWGKQAYADLIWLESIRAAPMVRVS